MPVLASGAIITIAGTALGLKKLDQKEIPKVAILASVFYVASLIHVPSGLTSVHLLLNGLLGVILGWAAFPAILIALLMQWTMFNFGGITVLGVNTTIMALPAVISYYIFGNIIKKYPKYTFITSFMCGSVTIAFTAILLFTALTCSGEEFFIPACIALLTHLPIMVIEGFITAFCVLFLKKVKPEIFRIYEKK